MEKIWIGKIVNTHGIKGEIRLMSDFERKDLAFALGNSILIQGENYTIERYRVHKNFDMLTLEGYDNINQVLPLKGCDVYIDKEELALEKDEVLLQEMIGYNIVCEGELLGTIVDYQEGRNPLFEVKDEAIHYYIPRNGSFIKQILKEKRQVEVTIQVKELML